MKKLLAITILAATAAVSYGQGTVNFVNSSTTLISAGGTAVPGANTSPFVYAIFLAPSATVSAAGQATTGIADNRFLNVGAYQVNHPTAVGRLQTTANNLVVQGGAPGGTVDFIVRGWSANAGATWAEALAFWNNGQPSADMFIGSSLIGNDILLGDGGAIGSTTVFGAGANQIGGFNMQLYTAIPEPSSMALAGLGAASLLIFRRRK